MAFFSFKETVSRAAVSKLRWRALFFPEEELPGEVHEGGVAAGAALLTVHHLVPHQTAGLGERLKRS